MKMMSPNTRIDWVEDPLFDAEAPAASFLTDATNISCAIITGYTLNPTKSDVDTTKTICDIAEVETPVRYNYEGSLTFHREGDLENNTSAYARAFEFFKSSKKTGYLVRRVGLASTVPAAAGQIVSSFKFMSDNSQDMVDDNLINFMVPFKQQGHMALFKTLV